MAEVEVENLDELLRDIRRLEGDVVAKEINKSAADVVLDEADRNVPEVSGRLRRSGRTSGQAKAGVVRYGRASVPYAGPIHFGHNPREQGGFTLPNPWLYDAADRRRREVIDKYQERVNELGRRF